MVVIEHQDADAILVKFDTREEFPDAFDLLASVARKERFGGTVAITYIPTGFNIGAGRIGFRRPDHE